MHISESILHKICYHRNMSVLLHGRNTDIIDNLLDKEKARYVTMSDTGYHVLDDIYYVTMDRSKKVIDLLKDISISPNFYSEHVRKKIIILMNFNELSALSQLSIKTIIDTSYLSCIFIIHTNNIHKVSRSIVDRFIFFSLPPYTKIDETNIITYNNIINIVKKPPLKKSIKSLRELCYMYYMNHTHSTYLQRLLVTNIGNNLCLPNSVKTNIIEDMCRINNLYQHSYRKPIFLEFIVISLFKHLENYTYNL